MKSNPQRKPFDMKDTSVNGAAASGKHLVTRRPPRAVLTGQEGASEINARTGHTNGQRREIAAHYCNVLWGDTRGYVYGALGVGGHRDRDHGNCYKFQDWRLCLFRWPEQADELIDGALDEADDHDVFVCPMLRTTGDFDHAAKAETGQGGRHAWVDLDGAWTREREERLTALLRDDSMVVHSGSGRHAYIALDDLCSVGIIEDLNQRLALHLGGDAKWRNNSVLRLPGTFNHKGRADGRGSTMVRMDQR